MQAMDSAQSQLIQITERVRAAAADAVPLRIRGGGTKDFHGLALQGELLDTRALAGVVSYEPSELVVTVRAGTPLAEVEALLAAQGQCLPFEPPHFEGAEGRATVGGMVAAGLSGPSRASVGSVRDFVLGLEMVNGQGELLRYGGQVMKNVAGYDVSRLMAGSWGTLGLVTEVSLKVLPAAPAEATLRFACSQQQALDWLNAWGGQPLPLNASCWLQEQGAAQGTLYLRLRGARAAVQAACERLGGDPVEHAAADWQACREQQLPWFTARAPGHVLWRLSVPQTAPVLALPAGCTGPLIEWHGALRWVQAPRALGHELRALARAAGGAATLFRSEAAGQPGAEPDFEAQAADATALLHARLKQAFDPAGIFNRGRMAAAW
jgi:glycolate oxidase FAD binding subunit